MADISLGHNQADLTLSAVSVGVESHGPVVGDGAFDATDVYVNHEIVLSIRAHTAWLIAPSNQDETVTLLDNIVQKLKANINLGGGYRIMGFSSSQYREEFQDSGTRGGQVNIVLHKVAQYTQET